MNNLDKTAQALYGATALDPSVCQGLAGMLYNFGLVTPDPPEPQRIGQKLVWHLQHHGWEVIATDGYIRLSDERGAFLAVDRKTAREVAHALLAAANYAEGNRD